MLRALAVLAFILAVARHILSQTPFLQPSARYNLTNSLKTLRGIYLFEQDLEFSNISAACTLNSHVTLDQAGGCMSYSTLYGINLCLYCVKFDWSQGNVDAGKQQIDLNCDMNTLLCKFHATLLSQPVVYSDQELVGLQPLTATFKWETYDLDSLKQPFMSSYGSRNYYFPSASAADRWFFTTMQYQFQNELSYANMRNLEPVNFESKFSSSGQEQMAESVTSTASRGKTTSETLESPVDQQVQGEMESRVLQEPLAGGVLLTSTTADAADGQAAIELPGSFSKRLRRRSLSSVPCPENNKTFALMQDYMVSAIHKNFSSNERELLPISRDSVKRDLKQNIGASAVSSFASVQGTTDFGDDIMSIPENTFNRGVLVTIAQQDEAFILCGASQFTSTLNSSATNSCYLVKSNQTSAAFDQAKQPFHLPLYAILIFFAILTF